MKLYTVDQLSEIIGITPNGIRKRVDKLKLLPTVEKLKGGGRRFYWNESQLDQIRKEKNKTGPKRFDLNVIYVHTIWHILPSKMNFN